MSRKQQIQNEAYKLAAPMLRDMVSRTEMYEACIKIAEWADENQPSGSLIDTINKRNNEIHKLEKVIKVYEAALKEIIPLGNWDNACDDIAQKALAEAQELMK